MIFEIRFPNQESQDFQKLYHHEIWDRLFRSGYLFRMDSTEQIVNHFSG